MIDFVNGLLSQSAFKPYKNSLKMPALILDKHVKLSRFISNNGLVKDPRTVEKERYMMNPWAHEETEIFIEKLAAFGKDFTKIASFLDHKTVADCIEFYYKNHKSNWFEEARKNSGFIKQRRSRTTTYLVASGKRRNPELNAASLDILGAASEIAVNIDNAVDIRQKFPSRTSFGDHLLKESDSPDMLNNERETEAADVLANICGSLSTEATSSSITTSLDLIDGYQDPVIPRISSSIKRASTPEVTQDEVDGECSDGSCSELNPTDWSDEEKSIFIQAVSSYGKDFVMVSRSVRTKSMNQCKVFFSKARKCFGLELVQPETGPASGDDNGGSDIEDEFQMVKSEPDSETSNGENRLDPLDSTTNEPVFENSSNLGGIEDDKPVTDIKHSTKDQRVKDASFVSGCDHQIVAIASFPESEPRIKQEVDLSFLKASEENQCRSFLSNGDSNSVKVNDTNSGNGMIFKPLLAGNDSHASVDQKPDVQKRAEVGTCSAEKSGVSLLLQSGCLASATSSTLLSVPTKYQNASDRNPPLPVEVTQNFPSHSLISTESSSKILQGYPVSLQTVKGKNGDEKLNPGWRTDFLLQKCKETRQTDVSPPASGGVKLFGKILTSPSPSPSSSSQQKPHKPIEDAHRPRHEPLNQKLSCDQKGDLDFSQSKSNLNNYVPTEGRFGFWDGSRIQRGTPPVPDSALLLAKYPSAFSNFTLPPSVPQSREFSSSSIGLSIKEGETLVEMQRRMMYGGDRCSLTDPVAAIRMHYAKAEQLQMKGGNGVDEEDRWIGRRDVGR